MEEDAEVLEKVKDEELPEEMKGMNAEERKAYVEKKAEERKVIQAKIQEAAKKRADFITEKRKETAGSEENTLDAVMLKTVRDQAIKKEFKFEK